VNSDGEEAAVPATGNLSDTVAGPNTPSRFAQYRAAMWMISGIFSQVMLMHWPPCDGN